MKARFDDEGATSMEYVTPKDKAGEWGLTSRRVEVLCGKGRVSGAYRLGRVWAIPKDAEKPIDGRTKAARKVNESEDESCSTK